MKKHLYVPVIVLLLIASGIFWGLLQEYSNQRHWQELKQIGNAGQIEEWLGKEVASFEDQRGNVYHVLRRSPYVYGLFHWKEETPLALDAGLPGAEGLPAATSVFLFPLIEDWYLFQQNQPLPVKVLPRSEQMKLAIERVEGK